VSLVRPQLVHTALQKVAKEDMSATLRMLVDEGITVRDLRTILELFASEIEPLDVDTTEFIVYDLSAAMHRPALAADSAPMGPSVWCELVRVATKRLISHRVGRGGNRLDVVLLHNDLEKRLAGAKAIVAADEQRLIEQTAAALRRTPSGVASPAFVTSQDVRRLVREVLRSAFPNLSVLAYNELRTDMDIQPFARVAFD
jgi:type III secretory pathway component EscV